MSEINNFEELMRSMIAEVEIPKKNFYVHVDKTTLKIVGVSPHVGEDTANVEIAEELAIKFLTGTENLTAWAVIHENEKYEIVKKNIFNRFINSRVDVLALTQLEFKTVDDPDVSIILDTVSNKVLIYYNGLSIKQFVHPLNFYFTREDDPSYLRMTFALCEQTLSHLAYEMSLDKWPEEVKLAVEDADDISVYTIKSKLKISLSKI